MLSKSRQNPSLDHLPDKSIRILLIEDNPGDAALIRASLKKAFTKERVELHVSSSLADGLDQLKDHEFDLVSVDLNLPDSHGLEAVEQVRKFNARVPVVVLTGWADREIALNALRFGAQDYLIKGSFDPDSLKWSINCAIARQRTLNQLDIFRQNEMEKNEFKDRVLSMTAHDIRGSIVGVLGFLRNILDGEFIDNLSPEQQNVFRLMHKNCEDVVSLSDEIVQARRAQSAAFSPTIQDFKVQEFLEDCIEKVTDSALLRRVQILLDFSSAPERFSFDPKIMSRALKNLIQNAIKFSNEGTEVLVKASLNDQDELVFSVRDTGVGICTEDLPYLFDELNPLKSSNQLALTNGLGLVIVKRIVEAHKGRVWAESEKNKGSCFYIAIPRPR